MRRPIVPLGALAVAASLLAAPARADGDPASDVLFAQRVFLPYSSAVSPALAAQLRRAIPASLRVAMIGSPQDLGSVPSLFGKPAAYARFLGAELQFVYTGRLLVVMPQGAALSQRGRLLADPAVSAAQPGAGGDSLARTALALVGRLAGPAPPAVEPERAAEPAPAPARAPPLASGPIRPTWLPADLSTRRAAEISSGLVAAFVAAGGLLVWLRRRRLVRRLPPAIDLSDPYRYRGP